MNELADRLAEQTGMSKRDAQQFLAAVVETIQEGVNNDKIVKIKGLGTFKVIDVEARESVNVNTGERVTIESHQKLTFTPDSAMKELVNKPFSQFETVILNEGVDFDDLSKNFSAEETSAEEPVAEKPVVEEPVIEEPVVEAVEEETPVVETPTHVTPVSESQTQETPVVEEKVTVVEEKISVPETVAPVVEKVTVENESPAKAEVPATEETPMVEVPVAEETEEEALESSHSYWWLWLLLALVACVASFAGGYILGRHVDRNALLDEESTKTDSAVVVPAPVAEVNDTLQADTMNLESVQQEAPKTVEAEKKEVSEQPKAEQPQKVEADSAWKKYEDMDSRVRTGAYRIIGLDHTVKVKSGDTTKRIARRTLGEGMECYIEVFNNITSNQSLKEGQDIKIPQLELKKKRKQQ